jgi:hypothetical protein
MWRMKYVKSLNYLTGSAQILGVTYWAERNRLVVVQIIRKLKKQPKNQLIIWTTGGPLLSAQ